MLVYGLRGHVFRSTDGGVSWARLDSGLQVSVTAATLDADGVGRMPSVPVLDAPSAECRAETGQGRDSAQAHCSMKGAWLRGPSPGSAVPTGTAQAWRLVFCGSRFASDEAGINLRALVRRILCVESGQVTDPFYTSLWRSIMR